jgi:MFS family permease
LTVWLETAPVPLFTLFAIATSFTTYFCMYAFRKPFAAAKYEGLAFFLGTTRIDLKTAFVVSQIIGYALSKVIGIRVCSEFSRGRRAVGLAVMIGLAALSLLLFAVLPNELKTVAIFANGLSLGMVWGLVVWYLEGRRTSEMLLAGLSCAFILASGVVKDVGIRLMSDFSIDQFWMPFATGLIFLPLFLISVYLLDQIPQPDDKDVLARVERKTMRRRERVEFVTRFAPGLVMLMIAYFFLTAYRDFRDNFGVEIFAELGYGETETAIFTRSELWVAFGVLGALAALNLIRNNRLGLIGAFVIMAFGTALLGVGTLLLDAHRISGLTWMIMCGLGVYLAYVPYGSVLFDRLIASTRAVGTAVFTIYVADAIGYVGVITVLTSKDKFATNMSRLDFLRNMSYFMAILGTVLLVSSCLYFLLAHKHVAEPAWEGIAREDTGD